MEDVVKKFEQEMWKKHHCQCSMLENTSVGGVIDVANVS